MSDQKDKEKIETESEVKDDDVEEVVGGIFHQPQPKPKPDIKVV